jgi:hypothetical protein
MASRLSARFRFSMSNFNYANTGYFCDCSINCAFDIFLQPKLVLLGHKTQPRFVSSANVNRSPLWFSSDVSLDFVQQNMSIIINNLHRLQRTSFSNRKNWYFDFILSEPNESFRIHFVESFVLTIKFVRLLVKIILWWVHRVTRWSSQLPACFRSKSAIREWCCLGHHRTSRSFISFFCSNKWRLSFRQTREFRLDILHPSLSGHSLQA